MLVGGDRGLQPVVRVQVHRGEPAQEPPAERPRAPGRPPHATPGQLVAVDGQPCCSPAQLPRAGDEASRRSLRGRRIGSSDPHLPEQAERRRSWRGLQGGGVEQGRVVRAQPIEGTPVGRGQVQRLGERGRDGGVDGLAVRGGGFLFGASAVVSLRGARRPRAVDWRGFGPGGRARGWMVRWCGVVAQLPCRGRCARQVEADPLGGRVRVEASPLDRVLDLGEQGVRGPVTPIGRIVGRGWGVLHGPQSHPRGGGSWVAAGTGTRTGSGSSVAGCSSAGCRSMTWGAGASW